jgi:aldose 1-epimerase
MNVDKKPFGNVDGKNVDLYTITNAKGVSMAVTNYGGIITSLVVPDKNGTMTDVALGYNDVDSYVKNSPYFGAIVGRFGNRIEIGRAHV